MNYNDFTINKPELENFVRERIEESGYSGRIDSFYRINFPAEEVYMDIARPASDLYQLAVNNYSILRQRGVPVPNHSFSNIELEGERWSAVFQPLLNQPSEKDMKETAELYLDAAENNLLLDPKFSNVGVNRINGEVQYHDTTEITSVATPSNESFGIVKSLAWDEITFEDIVWTNKMYSDFNESIESLLRENMAEIASERYSSGHRLHPETD